MLGGSLAAFAYLYNNLESKESEPAQADSGMRRVEIDNP